MCCNVICISEASHIEFMEITILHVKVALNTTSGFYEESKSGWDLFKEFQYSLYSVLLVGESGATFMNDFGKCQ